MNRGFVSLIAVAILVGIVAVSPASAEGPGGDEPACALTTASVDGDAACADTLLEQLALGKPAAGATDPSCRLAVEFVSWTSNEWATLAQAVADDATPCGEYWIAIPPLAADKKGLRVLQDDVIRAMGPNIHPVAEFTLGSATGWARWVQAGNGSWFDAGVNFRRRMAAAGYDVTKGETWLVNEFDRSTMRDGARTPPDSDAPPGSGNLLPAYRRADMQELLRGLYFGDAGMPPAAGAVEFGIHFRHQNIPNVAQYRQELQNFLADGTFWSTIDPYVRWFAVETYPDVRYWGVPGSSRNERMRHLDDYIFHVLDLARGGSSVTDAARAFLERTYLPLLNSGWRARGGDQFQFVTGHGNTIVDITTMQHFVSEQIHAVRHYAGTHTRGAPQARLGFSWELCNRASATEAGCPAFTTQFRQDVDTLAARIANAVHYAYRQGGASAVGACGAPGAEEKWCDGQVPGAQFTEAWEDFDNQR